jgi:CRP-like cAMP-binding protein
MGLEMRLRDVPHFVEFSDDELKVLADLMEEVEYQPNEVIFNEKSPTTAVYFILGGRINIYKMLFGSSNFLTILERNDLFGEVAFSDQKDRSASACALDETAVAKFAYEHFDVIQKQNPEIGMKLLRALMKELTRKFRAVNSGLDVKSSEQTIVDLITTKQQVKISTQDVEYICSIMYADKSGTNPFVKIDLKGQIVMIPFHQVKSITLPNKYGKF